MAERACGKRQKRQQPHPGPGFVYDGFDSDADPDFKEGEEHAACASADVKKQKCQKNGFQRGCPENNAFNNVSIFSEYVK